MAGEQRIQDAITQKLKANDYLVINLTSTSLVGIPDLIAIKKGEPVAFIEVKDTGKKPRPLQYVVMQKLQRYGAAVVWTDTAEQILQKIKENEPIVQPPTDILDF